MLDTASASRHVETAEGMKLTPLELLLLVVAAMGVCYTWIEI